MKVSQNIQEALTSMLRTDYIPIDDTKKLTKLSEYYIDYFGYLNQILDETDQLIIGRRGTGKTTLLYRALIECINSWKFRNPSLAKPKTLGVYIDLSKCHSLSDADEDAERNFEHIFTTELYEALKAELYRDWPALASKFDLIPKFFLSKRTNTAEILAEIAEIIKSGIPRSTSKVTKRKSALDASEEDSRSEEIGLDVTPSSLKGTAKSSDKKVRKDAKRLEYEDEVTNRLMISDILRSLGKLKDAANISHIILLVDEFSSLSEANQRKFTTLLRKILGNHNGVYVKLCAITDNYKLGSSIIVQRDIFEVCLDFDRYVELNESVNSAFDNLGDLAKQLVTGRLKSFAKSTPEMIFESPNQTWNMLSKACVAIPRTIGIILKHAYQKANSQGKAKIRISDIESGIKYASTAYSNQFDGVVGVLIPQVHEEIKNRLIEFLNGQKKKGESSSCFFLVRSQYEERLKYLNMFFLVHLITKGRTTKKEKTTRNLYMLDYGLCIKYNIDFNPDKNVIRQQRFVFDGILAEFDHHFKSISDKTFKCPQCGAEYKESQLLVAGRRLEFCPLDRTTLIGGDQSLIGETDYTEEEVKIIGAIRSAKEEDKLMARQIADDVGCYVQKVSKFAEKAEDANYVERKRLPSVDRLIYFKRE